MAKCACEIGLMAAARKHSKELGRPMSYTTIQLILREEAQDQHDINSVPPSKHGWPLLLGEELDSRV